MDHVWFNLSFESWLYIFYCHDINIFSLAAQQKEFIDRDEDLDKMHKEKIDQDKLLAGLTSRCEQLRWLYSLIHAWTHSDTLPSVNIGPRYFSHNTSYLVIFEYIQIYRPTLGHQMCSCGMLLCVRYRWAHINWGECIWLLITHIYCYFCHSIIMFIRPMFSKGIKYLYILCVHIIYTLITSGACYLCTKHHHYNENPTSAIPKLDGSKTISR